MTEEPGVTVNKISPSGSLKVEVITGDEFCFNQSISNINFLKIDCEGFDDKVLMGFEQLIIFSNNFLPLSSDNNLVYIFLVFLLSIPLIYLFSMGLFQTFELFLTL